MDKKSDFKSFLSVLFGIFGLIYLAWKFRKRLYKFYLKLEKWVAEAEMYVEKAENILPQIEEGPEPLEEDEEYLEMDQLPSNLNSRQQAILGLLEDGGEADMKAIAEHISGVSERTLRRDMNALEAEGIIERIGKTKDTIYRLA